MSIISALILFSTIILVIVTPGVVISWFIRRYKSYNNVPRTGVHIKFNVLYVAVSANPDRYQLTSEYAYLKTAKDRMVLRVRIDMAPLELYRYRKWYKMLATKQREDAEKVEIAAKLSEQLEYIDQIKADVKLDEESAKTEMMHAKAVAEQAISGNAPSLTHVDILNRESRPIVLGSNSDEVMTRYLSYVHKHNWRLINGSLFKTPTIPISEVATNENRVIGFDSDGGGIIVRNYIIERKESDQNVEENCV